MGRSSSLARICNPLSLMCPSLLCHNFKFELLQPKLSSRLYNFPYIKYKDPSFFPIATVRLTLVSFHISPQKWLTKPPSSSFPIDIRLRCMLGTCLVSFNISLHPMLVIKVMSSVAMILPETWFSILISPKSPPWCIEKKVHVEWYWR